MSNLPAKRYKSGERTTTDLRYVFDSGTDSESEHFFDLAMGLSMVNRRAYRQGLYYYCAGITVHCSGNAWVSVQTVPDTWMSKSAHRRGYRAWQKMHAKAQEAGGAQGARAPYRDFKVAMAGDHVWANTKKPVYGLKDPNEISCDEWALSTFYTEDPDNAADMTHSPDAFTAHMVGPNNGSNNEWTSVGLLSSYATTKETPTGDVPTADPPNTAQDVGMVGDPITNLFDAGDTHDEILGAAVEENDLPPYDADLIIGQNDDKDLFVAQQLATGGAGAGTVAKAGGFCVPFGLVKLSIDESPDVSGGTAGGGGSIGTLEVIFHMVPGPYNGVYAERA